MKDYAISKKLWSISIMTALFLVVLIGISMSIIFHLKSSINKLAEVQIPAVRSMSMLDMAHDATRAIVLDALLNSKNPSKEKFNSIKNDSIETAEAMKNYALEFQKLNISKKLKMKQMQ